MLGNFGEVFPFFINFIKGLKLLNQLIILIFEANFFLFLSELFLNGFIFLQLPPQLW